jgi:hypothetical protein
LVRSTLKLVEFSGIFTLVPLEDVRVTVFTSTMKESRFVLGGGVSGAAVNVKLRVALPPPPPPPGGEVLGKPLHEIKKMADRQANVTNTFRRFMSPRGNHVQTDYA